MAQLARTAVTDATDDLPAATGAPYAGDVSRVTLPVTSQDRKRRLGSRSSAGTTVPLSTTPDPEADAIRAAMVELAKL